ncbi:MAG: hypothetical protein FJ217_04385 [Ignavibacteria bacterium]|nr:hypothetical protein [Ignavibacteria bacterium]
MNIKTFAVTLVVSAIVTFLYSLSVHAQGGANWETSFQPATILAVALPWIHQHGGKRKNAPEARS